MERFATVLVDFALSAAKYSRIEVTLLRVTSAHRRALHQFCENDSDLLELEPAARGVETETVNRDWTTVADLKLFLRK